MNERLLQKIIAAAYGSAGPIDRMIVWYHTKKSRLAEETFNSYKNTALGIKTIKEEQCPAGLVNVALADVQNSKKRKHNINLAGIFLSKGFAFSSAVVIIIAISVSVYYNKKSNAEEAYTEEQIELAEKQTKEALAIVGKVLNNSKTILKNEVLYKQVSKPINVSIRTVNYLFKKGEKYESIN
jgi:orotate phosphoribosyltransferase-like protein